MKANRMKTVAVIPAYNEEDSIAGVVLRTRRHVDGVIVCDDGSKDMTFMIAEALGAKVIRHATNQGKGEAFRTLFKEIVELGPDIVVTLDGDGQHDPDQIPMLVKPIEKGESDVVVGSRYVSGSKMDAPLYRRFGLRLINFFCKKVARVHTKDTQSGFRAYSKKAFEYMIQCDAKGYGIESEQLVWASRNGLRVMEVPISVDYNGLAGTSKKSPLSQGADLISTLFRLVLEERPLKYLGLPGISLTGIGVILGLYVLWKFNITRLFDMPLATLTLGAFVIGLLMIIAAITLHGLKRMSERLKKFSLKLSP